MTKVSAFNPVLPIRSVDVLSNTNENSINDMDMVGIAHIEKDFSFLINGIAK